MDEKNIARYRKLYKRSITQPETFWTEQAERYITWFKKWDTVISGNIAHHNVSWFNGAKLNPCYNCLDRHLPKHADHTAIIWEGDEPNESKKITYAKLHNEVCRFANALLELKIRKGDRVCIYLPMIPEAIVAILACARIGAVHSVVFAGFSPNALKNRVIDAQCKLIVTADENKRGGKIIPLKENVDKIIGECDSIEKVIVVKNTASDININDSRDIWYHDIIKNASPTCEPVVLDANDPLFILYTSGSTGKPKGILHTVGGYMVYTAMTFKWIFDYQDGDIYWCTADVGWITGHSYTVYGPLANGATTVIFAGTPQYPSASRFWEVIDKHHVNIFYTAPTAIRALMREGDAPVKRTSRKSLKLLGTVGEPINPDVWQWYYDVVGEKRCPIVDTWWQTETGGIVLTPLPHITPLKPGAASWPFFGIVPAIVDNNGQEVAGETTGNLVIKAPWPGMLNTIYNDQERFVSTYFSHYPGFYETGDGAKCDKDGYYWITGRVDDVINVSGHRFDTAEIESALVEHPKVSEAAVVGYPHNIKGQGIYAFVTPLANVTPDDTLKKELINHVRNVISPIAKPDKIQFTNDLPKTRSGKIMRRILRKLVAGQYDELGDTSTLANPEIIEKIKKELK